MKADSTRPLGWVRQCLRLYPRDFRERFGEEVLQACRDRLRDRPTEKARLWVDIFSDLATSILQERIEEARSAMKLSNVFKGIGSLLIVLWFVVFLFFTACAFWGWMLPESARLLIDRAFASPAMIGWKLLVTVGPLIAFLTFLTPALRVQVDRSQRSLNLQVLPMSRFSVKMALLSGALSLVILLGYLVTRL